VLAPCAGNGKAGKAAKQQSSVRNDARLAVLLDALDRADKEGIREVGG
jgi:hypothetical protein